MKKILYLLALTLFSITSVFGQHIVRIDTSIVPYIQFDHNAWVSDPNHKLSYMWSPYVAYEGSPQIPFSSIRDLSPYPNWQYFNYLAGEQLQYNYIEGGANIRGISVGSYAYWNTDLQLRSQGDSTTEWYPLDDVFLYDALPDTLLLLKTMAASRFAPWGPRIPFMAREFGTSDGCNTTSITPEYLTLPPKYILFDKPVHVEDSFYVGTSQKYTEALSYYSQSNYEEGEPNVPFPLLARWEAFSIGHHGTADSNCFPPPMKIKQRWTQPEWLENWWIAHDSLASRNYILPEGYVRNRWINRTEIDFFLILPLIEAYDTLWDYELPTCPQVEWFNVTGTRGDTTILRWQSADDLHTEWQLSYGPKGIDPDNGTLVDCRAASWRHIDSLHTRDSMSAWVRTVCRDEGYLRYSDWSHEVSWGGRDSSALWTEQPQGNIRLEGLVRLTPNPATDEVTITSAYRLTGVEVYAMDGRLRYQAPAQGLTCRFAVQGWPRGTYLVLVQTAAGTSTKKLVVR